MLSIFEKLFSLSVKFKNLILSQKVNSPTIKFGKNNNFIVNGAGVQPRSKGPYLIIKKQALESSDDEFFRFSMDLLNLGSKPASNTTTRTEIYIGEELKFKPAVTASSIIPPGHYLNVLTQDPKDLVAKCTLADPSSKLVFVAEYEDSSGNKFMYLKAFWYNPQNANLSTREEKNLRLNQESFTQNKTSPPINQFKTDIHRDPRNSNK